MKRRAPKDPAASVRRRLLNKARESGRPFNEILQYFAMERFLYRPSRSQYANSFVLKGALMFHVWRGPFSRPTMDIDLLGRFSNGMESVITALRSLCTQEVEPDGLVFEPASVTGERIIEEMELSWYSITASGMDGIENKAIENEIHTASDRTSPLPSDRPRVFIVYGHDPESLEKLDHLLRKIGLDPETFDSLKKEGSGTVIEILERNMPTCDAVIALLTPDDEGRKRSASDEPSETPEPLRLRARQNVLIEAGYAIISKRRRSLIVALGGVDIPSDFEGIHRLQDASWNKELAGKIAKRFSQMGFNVDLGAAI